MNGLCTSGSKPDVELHKTPSGRPAGPRTLEESRAPDSWIHHLARERPILV